MKLGIQLMPIKALMKRGWLRTEMRLKLNEVKAKQYAAEMREGAKFPVAIVFIDPISEEIWVADGFHRIFAHKLNKEKDVKVELKRGGFHEAFLLNIEANREQRGLPFSTGDKQRCILTLMKDAECRQWTQARIAETVGCAIAYVSHVINSFAGEIGPLNETVVDKHGRVIKRKRPGFKSEQREERRQKVVELFAEGKSKNEIHKMTGSSRATVARYIGEEEWEDCPTCHGAGKIKKSV